MVIFYFFCFPHILLISLVNKLPFLSQMGQAAS